jgi:thioredoxin reductase (NADPH)
MLLKFAIDDFLSEKEYHNLSETSINSYMYTLLGFNNFCSEQQIIDTNDVKENTVKDFLKFCMKERDNNPTSISHKLRNLKAFFNYMVEEEIIGESPAKKIKPPKIDIKIEVYSDDDIKQMLNYYKRQHRREGTYLPFRNYMIIITFISTGIRLGELCNLEWSGVDLINDNMIVFGKKRQQSSVPITSKLKKELSQYHIYCQHVFDKMPKYVFVNAKGKKITEKVQKLKLEEEYRVVVTNQSKYRAKAVIIASGASPRMLGCPGEIDFRGRGVSYCATCDGAFYEGSNILVIGGGNAAVEEAVYLTKFADKVTLVHRRQELRAAKVAQERAFTNPKIDIIWDSVVEEISGNSSVEKVILKNVRSGERREMFVDGVFVYAGLEPNSAWVKGVVRLDEKGNILTDENMCTNIKGVYAAGDVRRKLLRQVLTAASDGAIAAFHAERYIESQFYGS